MKFSGCPVNQQFSGILWMSSQPTVQWNYMDVQSTNSSVELYNIFPYSRFFLKQFSAPVFGKECIIRKKLQTTYPLAKYCYIIGRANFICCLYYLSVHCHSCCFYIQYHRGIERLPPCQYRYFVLCHVLYH